MGAREPRSAWRSCPVHRPPEEYEGQVVINPGLLPDGRTKLILKDPVTGDFSDRVVDIA